MERWSLIIALNKRCLYIQTFSQFTLLFYHQTLLIGSPDDISDNSR